MLMDLYLCFFDSTIREYSMEIKEELNQIIVVGVERIEGTAAACKTIGQIEPALQKLAGSY